MHIYNPLTYIVIIYKQWEFLFSLFDKPPTSFGYMVELIKAPVDMRSSYL